MARYRKKPVEIEAVEIDRANMGDLLALLGDEPKDKAFFVYRDEQGVVFEDETMAPDDADLVLQVVTLEGVMTGEPGDFLIKGIQGEFYPCKPDIFEATYEAVSDG